MSASTISPGWTADQRIAALHAYAVLDTSPERAFDDIVALAGKLLDAPIVAVNLIDAHRQWFKSERGLGVREMALDNSLCKYALLEAERLVVPDTRADVRFARNPLVAAEGGLRFYAGELLKTPDGIPLGTLCVLDVRPRPQGLTPLQAEVLRTLAQQVQTQLELRKLVHEQQALLALQAATQATLLRAQERILIATDAAGLGLWRWHGADDVLVWENARPGEILGVPATGAALSVTRFLDDFVHPDDAPLLRDALEGARTTGQRLRFQGRVRRSDGALRWIDFIGQPQHAADGGAPSLVGVISDITERKLTESVLQASRTRFENIVSEAATGVVQADVSGRIMGVNRTFCTMVGYAREELLGRSVHDITAAGSLEATRDALARVVAGEGAAVVQKEYVRKDGSVLPATSSISPEHDAAGLVHGIVAIVVDTTHSRQAEAHLRKLAADLSEADRRKSDFLATLAHELRNPLAPISSGLALLRLSGDKPETVARVRPMMERQLAQMVRLIDDLLDLARISSGKIELQPRRIGIEAVLASALETSQPFIDHAGHRLSVQHASEPLLLDVDPTRIAQVFSNLLNNAAKYTPMGGRIDVTVRRDGDEVAVCVTDNGVGIPADALAHIFVMFNQVRGNMERAQGGLGVGLSLVRQLVEMHGGSVTGASAGAGQGATFTVRLPLAAAHPPAPAPVAAADLSSTACAGLRVMVVDDNVDAADMLAAMLGLQQHTVQVASSGLQAVRMAPQFAPDIAFLDIGMPGMNGYETAAALRALPGMDALVLVALTGWGNASDRARSQQAGFDHHLTKPADAAAIDAVMAQVQPERRVSAAAAGADPGQ